MIVPCDTSVDVVYKFGGRGFTIAPDDYIIGPAENKPGLCVAVFFSSSSYCKQSLLYFFPPHSYVEQHSGEWVLPLWKPFTLSLTNRIGKLV